MMWYDVMLRTMWCHIIMRGKDRWYVLSSVMIYFDAKTCDVVEMMMKCDFATYDEMKI
jgi:hypothetical protein